MPLAVALLAVSALSAAGQDAPGSLTGKLTDLHSRPLDGVTVTLKNEQSGAEVRTITGKGGAYRFRDLAPGVYDVVAVSQRLGKGSAGGVQIVAGHESRVQTALALLLDAVAEPNEMRAAADARPSPASAASKAVTQPAPAPPQPATNAPVVRSELPPESAVPITPPARYLDAPTLEARAAPPASPMGELPIPVPHMGGRSPGMMMVMAAASAARAALLAERPEIVLEIDAREAQEPELRAEQMGAIPLPERQLQSYIEPAPAAEPTAEDREVAPSAGASQQAAVPVDGLATQMAFGGRMRGQTGRALLAGPGAMESAIQEFRVAEFNDVRANLATGAQVSLQTRRGGAGLHGQASLFNRQGLLGAQNPFTQWVRESAPGSATTTPLFTAYPFTPANTENRWGAGVGSTLRWHRLQWFAAIDGNERNSPAVAAVKHPDHFFAQPSNDEMQVLSARLGLGGSDPETAGLQAYSGMLESLAGLLGPAPRTSQTLGGFGRLDWKNGNRYSFTLEGSQANWDSPGGGLTRASENFGTHSFGASHGGSTFALARWETIITPHLLAVTQGSLRRAIVDRPASAPSPFEQSFDANVWRQLPQMTVDSRYGFTIGNPARFGAGSSPDEHVYEAQQNVDWVHGRLLLRAGLDLRHSADATSMLRNHTGTYYYSSVENFISDALVFTKYGLGDALDPMHQHNCDQRGKAWRDPAGQLHGLGYLPCYSHYTQTLGPTDWHLSTNDWAGFFSTQWRAAKQLVMTAGLRWDREDVPPPIALVNNPGLPLTQRLPNLGSAWSPRVGLTWGRSETRWPALRAGYGMFAGRTNNGLLETALTETGSPKGDLKFFLRPTDNLRAGGAPPFPYVLSGEPAGIVKPGAIEFAPNFRNAQIHQGMVEMDERLPGRVLIAVSAMVSLARLLPVTMDTNYDSAVNPKTVTYAVIDSTGKGPIKSPQVAVPFFASWPGSSAGGRLNTNYQQITQIVSRANATYEAGTARVSRYAQHGLSFHARYTYGHAMDWNPEESAQPTRSTVFDPTNFSLEYGPSNDDQRHSAAAMAIWQAPWNRRGPDGWIANGWLLSATAQYHGGLPYTMRTAGSITREFETNGDAIVGLGPGMNGYGGDDRVYGVGRNTFRHPQTWKADVRLGRRFRLTHGRELELLAESFNLFNHQNVTEVETTGYTIEPGSINGSLPTLNFLTGLKPGQTEFGMPLNINAVDYYRERQFDLGLRLKF